MPCSATVQGAKYEVNGQQMIDKNGIPIFKTRRCGKKDLIAFKVKNCYAGTRHYETVISFCEDHKALSSDPNEWSRKSVYGAWGQSIEILETIDISTLKKVKNDVMLRGVRSSMKKMFDTKYGKKITKEEWVELIVEAYDEFVIQKVSEA